MATYYLNSSTGNDTTGSGTAIAPWQTISKGLTASTTSDTIILQAAAAVYPVTGALTFTTRTFIGPSASSPALIDGGSGNVQFQLSTSAGVYSFSNVTFQNIVSSAGNSFFQTTTFGTPSTVSFTNVTFHDITGADGSPPIGASISVTYNFTACLFYKIAAATNPGSFSGLVQTASGGTISMINCTVYISTATATSYEMFRGNGSTVTNILLKNNIFVNVNGRTFGDFGVLSYTGSTNNNNVGWTSFPSLTNTTTTDPLFVNVTNANFQLRPTSPAIDAGVII